MTFADFEILPGIVVSNDDPLKQGRVKACAPTLFNTDSMTIDDLMWISPFSMSGYQAFSKMEIGSKIWILHNVSNYFEYWYIPKFEINSSSPDVAGTDSDVILSRTINGELVQLYYSRENGFNIRCGNSSIIQDNTGKIQLNDNGSGLAIDEYTIKLGSLENATYSAVKAEELIGILSNFCSNLSALASSASSNPFTSNLAVPLINMSNEMQEALQNIKSDYVKIS